MRGELFFKRLVVVFFKIMPSFYWLSGALLVEIEQARHRETWGDTQLSETVHIEIYTNYDGNSICCITHDTLREKVCISGGRCIYIVVLMSANSHSQTPYTFKRIHVDSKEAEMKPKACDFD